MQARHYTVKVTGHAPFRMIVMDSAAPAEHVCRCIFGDRLEWVR